MKRRHLLKYGTVAACGYGLAACQNILERTQPAPSSTQVTTVPPLNLKNPDIFRTPEKTTLALGYAPTIAILPWLVAIEEGFFEKFDLEVKLYKQPDLAEVERGLLEGRFDAAITPFSLPLINQLKNPRVDFTALMQLHRHGSVFTLSQATWREQIRSGIDYSNFEEFARDYRPYVRSLEEPTFAVDNLYSTAAYLYRYWWAALGFHPELELDIQEFSPTQLHHKLGANAVHGYCSQEPWAQASVEKRKGYIGYLANEIWRGHPGSVITASAGWVEEHPNTAKALIAASLLGCHYCQDTQNARQVASLGSEPIGTHPSNIRTVLDGEYFYGGDGDRPIQRKDSPIWFDLGKRLREPDHANYCWQSHGVWLLTQMARWQHFDLTTYPKNGSDVVARAYPNVPYKSVAEAFEITVPTEFAQLEQPFIDQRRFTPEEPLRYLNQFKIRT